MILDLGEPFFGRIFQYKIIDSSTCLSFIDYDTITKMSKANQLSSCVRENGYEFYNPNRTNFEKQQFYSI